MIKLANQIGDTIIEVLLAVGILSLVLTGAYTISGRSFNNIRQAQEHTVALKLAEAQIEQLKQLALNSGNDTTIPTPYNIFNYVPNFCTDYIGSGLQIIQDTQPQCVISNGVPYAISISRINNGIHSRTFTALIKWDSINGGQNTVTLTYNLDQ